MPLRILKKLPMLLDRIAALVASGKPLELWWQDEARFGQKTKITRRWLFGAICPAEGKAAGLVLPKCDTAAMSLHLAEISQAVAPGAHAVVMLDQAGWHLSKKLKVPDNITLLPLPPKCPELNPTENIWQYIRENWLSNRIFRSYKDIVDHCCHAWNTLTSRPWLIMSIGMRDWAHGF